MVQHRESFLVKYGAIETATGLPQMPDRFLEAEDGDVDKALERWRATLEFRAEEKCDEVLKVPHPDYDTIQHFYPQSWYCRDKLGHVVYIERPGGVDIAAMKKNGITVKHLLWHYMYCMEYLWQVTSPRETDRLTTVLDLAGVSLFIIVGDVRKFIKLCVAMTSAHYPARGHKLFIVNAPGWFGTVWSWIKPMLNASIDEKLKICSGGKKQNAEMQAIIDEDNLPAEYGGKNKTAFNKAPMDEKIREHVLEVLKEHEMEMKERV